MDSRRPKTPARETTVPPPPDPTIAPPGDDERASDTKWHDSPQRALDRTLRDLHRRHQRRGNGSGSRPPSPRCRRTAPRTNWLFELYKTQPVAHAVGALAFVCVIGVAIGSLKLRGFGPFLRDAFNAYFEPLGLDGELWRAAPSSTSQPQHFC